MNYISEILTIFSHPTINNISERVRCVDLCFETTSLPEYDTLYALICAIPSRDSIKLSFNDILDERIIFGNRNIISKGDYNNYLSEIDLSEAINVNISIEKEILFYPITSLDFKKERFPSLEENRDFNLNLMNNIEEYYNYILQEEDYQSLMLNPLNQSLNNKPKTLVMVGKVDCIKDEAKEYYEKLKGEENKYVELPFSTHGFLKNMDKELAEEVYGELNLFL